MKVKIWGCRGSIPRPNPEMARYGGNTPCIEVVASSSSPGKDVDSNDDTSTSRDLGGGHRIVLDLGSGAFDLGQMVLGEFFGRKKELDEPAKEGQAKPKFGGSILITHTHWDHIQGLPFFVPLYLPQFDWTIYGPRGVAKSLQESLSGQMQHDYFPVRLSDMQSKTKYVGLCEDTQKGFWVGGDEGGGDAGSSAPSSIKVTSKYLNHSVLTLGYKLEEYAHVPSDDTSPHNRKRAKRGVSVAYITDHEPFDHSLAKGGFVESSLDAGSRLDQPPSPDQSHTDFFKGVDVMLHDCQYLYKEYSSESSTSKEYWGHSTVEYVVEVAFYAGVKQLLLFHHDPQRTDEQMDDLVDYARSIAEELERQYAVKMGGVGQQRTLMKVDAAKEGDVYELDPFALAEGDDGVDFDVDNALDVESAPQKKPLAPGDLGERSVLLGLYQTEAGPIRDLLSLNGFNVKVLQSSDDIVQYAREHEPDAIVLDDSLFGQTGFEVCEEIRTGMGEWGKDVCLMVIAASSDGSGQDGASSESKEQLTADRLHLEDYVQGSFSPSYLLTRLQVSLLRMPLRWRRAPFLANESQRLAALHSTGLLDSDPEERFDRITRLCSSMFKVPVSAVSLVDKDRQYFKSIEGLPGVKETPRDRAFCAHAILDDGIMVVPDALQDERFADNPLVEGAPNVRFYAGCPIHAPSKEGKMPIGTLCLIDSKPHDLREEELQSLKDFGAMVEREVSSSFAKTGESDKPL